MSFKNKENILRSTLGGTVKPKDFATSWRSSELTSKIAFKECEAYDCKYDL